jgi:uncharacterized protein
MVSALLHDIARADEIEAKGKGKCHAKKGAEKAAKILRKIGFDDEIFIGKVCECVGKHRYRGNKIPTTIEEKIVYDADKLDSIGAIGIGRAFHFAGRIGARVHNTKEEALGSSSYSKNDSAYREYLVKLKDIPNRLLTATGKKLAHQRALFMEKFFEELNRETQ